MRSARIDREAVSTYPLVQAMLRAARPAACVAAVLAWASLWTPAPANGGQDDPVFEALTATWEAQRSEIVTARIRYRHVSTRPAKLLADLNAEQVREIVENVHLGERPEDLRVLCEKLLSRNYFEHVVSEFGDPWSVDEICVEGEKTRKERVSGGTGNPDIRVFDGEQDVITSSANKQVDLYAPGASRRYRVTPAQFRRVPGFLPAPELLQSRDDGLMQFRLEGRLGATEVLVDEATGLMVRQTRRGTTGRVLSHLLQRDPVTYPGDITLPSVVVQAKFYSGEFSDLRITMIEEARFNEDLPAETFVVAAPPGTKVLDRRQDPNRARFLRVEDPAQDVVSYADERAARIAEGGGGSPVGRWLVPINVALVILIAAVFWWTKRRRTCA